MIGGYGMGNVLQHDRFTGARRRDNKAALSLALRRNQINNAGGIVLFAANDVKIEFFGRIKRRKVVKIDTQLGFFRIFKINRINFGQGKITFVVFWTADFALYGIAGAQAEFFDLRRRNVNVIGTGQIVGFGRAQKTETVLQNFYGSFAVNCLIVGSDFFIMAKIKS